MLATRPRQLAQGITRCFGIVCNRCRIRALSAGDLEAADWPLPCLSVRYSPRQTVEELVGRIKLQYLLQCILSFFKLDGRYCREAHMVAVKQRAQYIYEHSEVWNHISRSRDFRFQQILTLAKLPLRKCNASLRM